MSAAKGRSTLCEDALPCAVGDEMYSCGCP